MLVEVKALTFVLSLGWFVIFWIVGGAIFALVSLAQARRVNKNRFSCLFTLLTIAAAYGAAYTGARSAAFQSPACVERIQQLSDAVPAAVRCSPAEIGSAAVLWGIILLALGILAMLFSRKRLAEV